MLLTQEKAGAIISYFTIAFYIIAGFLYTPFLIKNLGLSDYGLFILSTSIISYLSIDFGIGAAQTRFITRYRFEGKDNMIKELLGVTVKLYVIIDVILAALLILGYLYANDIFIKLSSEELEKFKSIFIITGTFIIFNTPTLPINGIFLAYEQITALKTFDLISKVLSITLLISVLILGYGVLGVVSINAGTILFIQFIKFVYIKDKAKFKINFKSWNQEILKNIGTFSIWATLAMFADKFFFAIIPTLLAILSTTKQIAFFAIVISIEGYILSLSTALSGIFLPRVMQYTVQNLSSEAQTDLMIQVGRIQLFVIGIPIIGLICLGKEFFYHWLGQGFDTSYYAMVIILIPCLFHLTYSIAEEMIYAQNKLKFRAFAYIIGSCISSITIYLLAPKYGAIGAAIGVFASFTIAHNIFIIGIYCKQLQINMTRFFKECQLKILPIYIIAGIVGILMQLYIDTNTLIVFLIKGAFWVIITILLLWKFVMNSTEKNAIKEILKLNR